MGCISEITVLTLLSNSAVILSIIRTKQQNNIFCMLVLFLSLSDCLIAFTHKTLIFTLIFKPKISCIFQTTTQIFSCLFVETSRYVIVVTAFERMVDVNRIQPSHATVSLKRAYLICSACLVIALITASLYTTFTVYQMAKVFHSIMMICGAKLFSGNIVLIC